MRRFWLSLILAALFLTACSFGDSSRWGNLRVELEKPQVGPSLWVANLRVQNETEQTQVYEYDKKFRYTIYVSQGGKKIYEGSFNPQEKSELMNLLPGAGKSHVVVWNYTDQAGKRVPPGTYQVKVELHAVTAKAKGSKIVGPLNVEVK